MLYGLFGLTNLTYCNISDQVRSIFSVLEHSSNQTHRGHFSIVASQDTGRDGHTIFDRSIYMLLAKNHNLFNCFIIMIKINLNTCYSKIYFFVKTEYFCIPTHLQKIQAAVKINNINMSLPLRYKGRYKEN